MLFIINPRAEKPVTLVAGWIGASCKEKLDRDVNAAINILINATGGAPGIHACGDCVRPAGFSGGLRSLKQEATDFSRLVAHSVIA